MVAAIFLDIDGVICCNLAGRLEESKLLALHEIVKATSAKVPDPPPPSHPRPGAPRQRPSPTRPRPRPRALALTLAFILARSCSRRTGGGRRS
jgi:hypothetical protein